MNRSFQPLPPTSQAQHELQNELSISGCACHTVRLNALKMKGLSDVSSPGRSVCEELEVNFF